MTRKRLIAWSAALLVGAQALFVSAYVNHEHTIYYWDHAMYFNMARQFYMALSQSLSTGATIFGNALAGNYNLIFALPSAASFGVFAPTRLVFILTNFFIFFLAYEMAFAFFLRRALNFDWRIALPVSLIACLLVPPLWLPLFEGYPDTGAAACLIAAAALGIAGPCRKKLIGTAIATGLILGFAVLLRRHFVYGDIALLLTQGGFAAFDIVRTRKDRAGKIKTAIIHFALCGLSLAALVFLVAPDFLKASLTTDYRALYLSYQRPALVFLYFVLGSFGVGLLLVAVSGVALLGRDKAHRKVAVFTALYVLIWLIVWCGGPDQMGHHYVLQVLPFFIATGLAGWWNFFSQKPETKIYIWGGAMVLVLAANSAWALWFSPHGVWPNDNGTPGLFSAPRPPVVRSDYEEWVRLADYLRQTTGPSDSIMIVGSSFIFNLDLLHSVYVDILGAPEMTSRFPKSPEIDHEEPAPLDVFAGSAIYLVPSPAQYHLDPAGQRVVTAAANQFPPPASRAAMFHADDRVFHLTDGVDVKIWRRKEWAPKDLHNAMEDIRRDGPRDPAFDQDWVTSTLPLLARIHSGKDNRTDAAALLDSDHRNMALFFDYPLAPGPYRLGFWVATDCRNPQFRLRVLDAAGHEETRKDIQPILMPGTAFQSFTVPSAVKPGSFLELDLSTSAAAMCRAEFHNMQAAKMP